MGSKRIHGHNGLIACRDSTLNFVLLHDLALCLSDTLNLNYGTWTRWKSLQARARRHRLWEEIDVDLVHGCKVLHVGEVHIVLDDLFEGAAREF